MLTFNMIYQDGYGNDVAARMASRATEFVVRTIAWIVYACFIYPPLLWLSVQIVDTFENVHNNELYSGVGFIVLFTYIFYCLMYFIKGIVMALKVNRKVLWMPLWFIAVLLTCGFQVSFIQYILEKSLNPPTGPVMENYILLSWMGALFGGVLIYRYYEFAKDSVPGLAFWAYRLGFKISLSYVSNPIDRTPDRSRRYI
jgi:hypothetical protein